MPAAVQERLIRLWASPQGAPKAALAASTNSPMGRQPGHAAARRCDDGRVRRPWRGKRGKPVVTFPIPGVPGATATATLDAKYMAERVVVKNGSTTTEFTYSNYQDWNNPLNKVEVLYAGKMTESRNGTVVRDCHDDGDGNRQRVCRDAGAGERQEGDQGHGGGSPTRPFPAAPTFGPPAPPAPSAQNQTTPRLADGQPDLTGNWQSGWLFQLAIRLPPLRSDAELDCTRTINQTMDYEFEAPSRFGRESSGLQTRALGQGSAARHVDEQGRSGHDVPAARASAAGRAPAHLQTDNDIIFIYAGRRRRRRRIQRISRDPDRRPQARSAARRSRRRTTGIPSGNGRATRWCSTRSRSSTATWLARGGFFHSDHMHVVEKFTRKGNQILYEVTVEDPEVLAEPWVMTPRTMRLIPNADAGLLPERGNCEVYEEGTVSSQIRH